MGYQTIILLFLAVLASSHAFYSLVPEGKEVIYHYHGTVKAGNMEPAFYSSAFVLDGNLHMQSDGNSTFMHFSGLKYKMFNGKYDEWHEFDTKLVELPEEMADLNKVFKVVYDTSGKAMGIATEQEEKQYIVNIKRGIANIMQLDVEQIHLDSQRPHAFHTVENNLHGKGKVYYNVRPTKKHLLVEKMDEYHSTKHLYIHTIKNVDYDYCAAIYDEPTTRDSQKIYHIAKKDNDNVIEYMEATGGVYYHTYVGNTDANYVYMNQSLSLLSVEPTETQFKLTTEKYYNRLMYYISDMENIEGPIPDITNGRRHYDMDAMIVKTEKMIHDAVNYLQKDNIKAEKPNMKDGQLLNRLMRSGFFLDLPSLEKLHENLMKSTNEDAKLHLQIYYHMLATLGTHASYYQIKNLIEQKKVKDYMAVSMLSNMPSNIKHPNKKIMDDMSAIIYWGDEISKTVRKAALLSYGTMLQKANDRYHRYRFTNIWDNHAHEHFEDHRDDLGLEESYPSEKHYEKYIMELVNRIKVSKDYDMVITCMEALHNTKMESVMHLLIPAVKGEWWDDNHLRMFAALAIGPMVAKHDELVYELYWPIMTDPNLSTAFRIVAYSLIMETQPSFSRLINIYWVMQSEMDSTLYLYHYRFMQTLSKTTDPCKVMFKSYLSQLMAYTLKPEFKGLTGYYQIDYNNLKYGTGQGMKWIFVHAPGEGEILFRTAIFNYRDNYLPTTPLSLNVRIDGLKGNVLDRLKLDLTEPNMMFTYAKFFKAFEKMIQLDSIKISISISRYNSVIMSYHYDSTNIKRIGEVFEALSNQHSSAQKYFDFYYPISKTIIIPTDMGFPVLFQQYVPDLHFIDYDIKKEFVNKIISYHVDFKVKKWSHSWEGITFYNPFVDVWQGVNKYRSYDLALPIYFDLSINTQQQSMNISWKRHEKPEDNVMGERMYVATMVFVKDDVYNGALKKSSDKCKSFELVTLGTEQRHDYILKDDDHMFIGYHFQQAFFDSERHMPLNYHTRQPANYEMEPEMNTYTELGETILKFVHWHQMEYLQPTPQISGYIARFEPSKVYETTNIDTTFRYNAEYKKGEMLLLPGSKHNIRATYSIKNKEKTSQTFDVNAIAESNVGHTANTLKLQLSRIVPDEEEFKLCIDASDKWDESGFKADLYINTPTNEGKCKKEDSIVEMTLTGKKSEEQLETDHTYSTCRERVWGDLHEQQTLDCYMDHASLRSYNFRINANYELGLSPVFETVVNYLVNDLYSDYYLLEETATKNLTASEIKATWYYPMIGGSMNMVIYTPKSDYIFNEIPESEWIIESNDMNIMYDDFYVFLHTVGLTKTCLIEDDKLFNIKGDEIDMEMPKEWTMYLSDTEKDSKHGVSVKKVEDHSIAIKFTHNDHTLEFIPNGDQYDVLIDGTKLTEHVHYHSDDWYRYQWLQDSNMVTIVTHHLGIHALYDGHHLQIEYPHSEMNLYGHCMQEATELLN